jgi:hypothetical protein
LDIWLSDSDGVLQSRHTIQYWSCTNTDISAATELFPYFCNAGQRSIIMDDFYVEAEEITLPVTMSSFTAALTSDFNAVALNWVVESETDHLGYNILRGEDDTLANSMMINTHIISEGDQNGTQISYAYRDTDIENGDTYYYWIESIDLDGTSTMFGPQTVTITENEDPGDTPEVVYVTGFDSVFPNPFNPVTSLKYTLKQDDTAKFTMFDLKGRKVGEMTDHGQKGSNTLTWDAQNLPSGVYFIKMNAGDTEQIRKVMLLK